MKIIIFHYSNKDFKKEILKKTLCKTLAISTGIIISQCVLPSLVFASEIDKDIQKINNTGYQIWRILKTIAMFVLAGFTARDILKELNDSSIRDISKIVVKYGFAWGVIVFILKIFAWIDRLSK